jgi:hypothetical protein
MQQFELVKLRIYGGGEALLVAFGFNDTHVNVCTQKELEAAKKENREPVLVGFPITDIIEKRTETS